ncbi:hypothetical protein FAGKG844_1130006 [Frankia sp. AgKG'84/4]
MEAAMPRPKFRLACCLCRNSIPLASDAYALDDEWKRRFPQMAGRIACQTCSLRNHVWQCRTRGVYVDGHIPITRLAVGSDAQGGGAPYGLPVGPSVRGTLHEKPGAEARWNP